MKKTLLILFVLAFSFSKADEGMWMPQLIKAMQGDMKKNGFKLTAEQIYSINKSSMKDAVAIFGGGCTAEAISAEGLILTNHHCGFSSIAALSSVGKDYLKDGFFAMKREEEIPCKGLTVAFIKRIEDVTVRVFTGLKANYSDTQKDSAITANIKIIEKEAMQGNHYQAFVRPFYYGNEYYLFISEVFNDVRLVGAPPENIGKFGGETDNWVWPRHNADFSVFRIYAGADNKPADYSDKNVPYHPLWHFPISLKGTQPGDFTMVYGFPGRTQEYLTSFAVDLLVNQQDPIRVALREKRLDVMEADMKVNDTVRLQYISRYANVANAYKKWKGEMIGLNKSNAVAKKQKLESEFIGALKDNPTKMAHYSEVLQQMQKLYADYAPLSRQYDYFTECLLGIDGIRMAGGYINVFNELRKKQAGQENKFADAYKTATPAIPFKNYNKQTDQHLFESMLTIYVKEIPREQMPYLLDSMLTAHNGNISALANWLYDNSSFVDNQKAKLMQNGFEQNAKLYERDPFYRLAAAIYQHYQKGVVPQVNYFERQISALQKEFMQGLRETIKSKKFYPDANGTLRVAYGKVEGYKGKDGVEFGYYTTLDGLVEKNSTGEEDFAVQKRLIELHAKKDYGMYADKNGQLRTAFIASNHTTGGNSGSPVINAKGELIGTNFDRNWEGTMSDVMYNVAFCRNIVLDIRFTLWMIDKYAGAGYLLKEMTIQK